MMTLQHQEALTILSSVPTGSRSVAVNMSLGRLYARLGVTASAVQCFTAVVAECPMALDAVKQLIALGADVGTVIDGLAAAGLGQEVIGWLRLWVQGHQMAHRKEYRAATKPFVDLQRVLPGNAHVLVNLAEWQWKQGYLPVAKMAFEKARACDPNMMDKMDVYGNLFIILGPRPTPFPAPCYPARAAQCALLGEHAERVAGCRLRCIARFFVSSLFFILLIRV